jgi:hypothetical protein
LTPAPKTGAGLVTPDQLNWYSGVDLKLTAREDLEYLVSDSTGEERCTTIPVKIFYSQGIWYFTQMAL